LRWLSLISLSKLKVLPRVMNVRSFKYPRETQFLKNRAIFMRLRRRRRRRNFYTNINEINVDLWPSQANTFRELIGRGSLVSCCRVIKLEPKLKIQRYAALARDFVYKSLTSLKCITPKFPVITTHRVQFTEKIIGWCRIELSSICFLYVFEALFLPKCQFLASPESFSLTSFWNIKTAFREFSLKIIAIKRQCHSHSRAADNLLLGHAKVTEFA
jgi:hypothetical protein